MGELVVFPENGVIITLLAFLGGQCLDDFKGEDVALAVQNHLVGDLNEEACHSFVCVVIPRYCVNHLDRVHQNRQGLFDLHRITLVKRLNEAFKGLEVLDIILGLIEVFCNSKLDSAPITQSQKDGRVAMLVNFALTGGLKGVVDSAGVLAPDLLTNLG